MLGEERGARAVRRLRRYRDLQDLDLPVILLVGGGTGTGKSTVATEVAYRLGITRVTSTDFIRQTMRAFFAEEFMPSVHYSSFEAGLGLSKAEEEESGDAALLGFLDQTRNVLVGVEAAIQRALDEGWSMVLEGVHLVPGMVRGELDGALVVHCVLAIATRRSTARTSGSATPPRTASAPIDNYLAGLPEIRLIQEYVLERAASDGRSRDRERVAAMTRSAAVMELVLEQAERVAAQGVRSTTEGPLRDRARAPSSRALTEWAALAGARWLGRDDQDAAEEAAIAGDARGLAGAADRGRRS